MTDRNFPKIFPTCYEERENISETMARTGLTYKEVRDTIVFYIISGSKYSVRLRKDDDNRMWIETITKKG